MPTEKKPSRTFILLSLKHTHRRHKAGWGGRSRGFSHGGTLKDLIRAFRDYICTGEQVRPGYLGPERFNDSNIWGYDEEGMRAVREQAGVLPVFSPPNQIAV